MGKYTLAIPAFMGIAVLAAAVLTFHKAPAAEPVVLAPAPTIDEPLAKTPGTETAILSGGCFWGMQVIFQHVKGVKSTISGYTGGGKADARYELVSTGTTGHAESVQITFDPSVISYGTILRIYFSVAADPTELNYQGPDHGTQYRGEIWAENMEQRSTATAYLARLAAAHIYSAPIVTRIDDARPFYPAEGYHQNYATLHPDSFYILVNDAPKVAALAKFFPGLYQSQPGAQAAAQSPAAMNSAPTMIMTQSADYGENLPWW
jgi:peptide-methionine (S)-S-oxide reductase